MLVSFLLQMLLFYCVNITFCLLTNTYRDDKIRKNMNKYEGKYAKESQR